MWRALEEGNIPAMLLLAMNQSQAENAAPLPDVALLSRISSGLRRRAQLQDERGETLEASESRRIAAEIDNTNAPLL